MTFVVVPRGVLESGDRRLAIAVRSFPLIAKDHFVLDLTRDKLNTDPGFTKRDLTARNG